MVSLKTIYIDVFFFSQNYFPRKMNAIFFCAYFLKWMGKTPHPTWSCITRGRYAWTPSRLRRYRPPTNHSWECFASIWRSSKIVWQTQNDHSLDTPQMDIYQHLQRGAKWFLKGVNSPFLGLSWLVGWLGGQIKFSYIYSCELWLKQALVKETSGTSDFIAGDLKKNPPIPSQ